jgi:hypothetical protein
MSQEHQIDENRKLDQGSAQSEQTPEVKTITMTEAEYKAALATERKLGRAEGRRETILELAHIVNNGTAMAVGLFDLAVEDPGVPKYLREMMQAGQQGLAQVTETLATLQQSSLPTISGSHIEALVRPTSRAIPPPGPQSSGPQPPRLTPPGGKP